jgi:hypothetical protein
MMRPVYFLAVILFTGIYAGAAGKYPVSTIPQHLLKNAHVVKRAEDVEFEIVSGKTAKYRYKYALTILDENGDDYAGFSEYYDKFRQIESVEGYLYDKDGNLLKKVKAKDMQDVSGVSNISLMDDNRIKQHSFYYRSYPYTIEYEVNIAYNQTFSFPYWVPQEYKYLSVEQSRFTVVAPADYTLRYKMFNYTGEPAQALEKNRKKYTWQASQLLPVKDEYAAPRWHERVPMVRIAPSQFAIDDYKGNMDSWQEFGKFIYALNQGRDQLPEAVKQKVSQLTATVVSEKEKVEILYQFLQQNTRYISIQLGIGGWQPFEAAYVSQKGYGDCKALSNYMHSLLKAAGIRSVYTLIKAGDFDHFLMEDFPSNQFNHAILCVPLQKDTMWLECTDQYKAAGYMGEFTGNRKALLIDENGGTLVSTPRYGLKENTQLRKITAKLGADGTLTMNIATVYKGVQQDDLSGRIDNLSKELVKKHLDQEMELATYQVNDFKYRKKKAAIPEISEELDITVSNYATISGKRLFITPNILSRGGARLTEEERTVDYVFDYEFHNEDEEEIEIPEGYEIEAAPKDVSITAKYGSYTMSAKVAGNKILFKRIREQFSGRFPAKEQKEIIRFFEDIYKADRSRFVLVKKG